MTYQDTKLPDPGLGRNPPRYRDPNSFGIGSIVALIFGTVVMIGAIAYAVSGPSPTTAIKPPLTTTGQGMTPTSPPDTFRAAPAPAARTTLPPVDQNVPAEKIAPPIPVEPR
jgi:hypothetical protein